MPRSHKESSRASSSTAKTRVGRSAGSQRVGRTRAPAARAGVDRISVSRITENAPWLQHRLQDLNRETILASLEKLIVFLFGGFLGAAATGLFGEICQRATEAILQRFDSAVVRPALPSNGAVADVGRVLDLFCTFAVLHVVRQLRAHVDEVDKAARRAREAGEEGYSSFTWERTLERREFELETFQWICKAVDSSPPPGRRARSPTMAEPADPRRSRRDRQPSRHRPDASGGSATRKTETGSNGVADRRASDRTDARQDVAQASRGNRLSSREAGAGRRDQPRDVPEAGLAGVEVPRKGAGTRGDRLAVSWRGPSPECGAGTPRRRPLVDRREDRRRRSGGDLAGDSKCRPGASPSRGALHCLAHRRGRRL